MTERTKAYQTVDEWLFEIENFSLRAERMTEGEVKWAKEAWKQAMRTARVQEQILVTEVRKVKRRLHELEEEIDAWAMENKFNDTYGDD